MAKTDPEIRTKLQRLGAFLDRHGFDGVLLQTRPNFAWVTGGRDNHVANNNNVGVAAIFATADARVCITGSNMTERMEREELADAGIEVVSFPWYDRAAAAIQVIQAMAGRKVAADADPLRLGLHKLPPDFAELRWSLTPAEVARYRDGARRATEAMEATCRALNYGTGEQEAAGLLEYHLRLRGCNPIVTLVGADDRVTRVRQPVPTDKKIEHYVMLVTCSEYRGLVTNLTRFVAFRPMVELEQRVQAAADIDAAVNLGTRPGRTLGEMFALLQQAYAAHGYPDEWRSHHQGGPTGYRTREKIATPDSKVLVRESQAFSWNPSIPGVKFEDTVLCTEGGVEVLTAPSDDWPTITGRSGDGGLPRPNILIR